MKTFSRVVAPLVLLLFLAGASSSHAWVKTEPVYFGGFNDDSWFVKAPANVGGFVGFVTSGIVTTPILAVTQCFGDEGQWFYYAVEGSRETGELLLSAPFYVCKKVVWDLPKAGITCLFGKKEDTEQDECTVSSDGAPSNEP